MYGVERAPDRGHPLEVGVDPGETAGEARPDYDRCLYSMTVWRAAQEVARGGPAGQRWRGSGAHGLYL